MSDEKTPLADLGENVQTTWQRFLDVVEPVRPELYRYCRHLTRNPWDAEDLTQDTLMRGFVTLGTMFHGVDSPRAWLFRIASNLWIDHARRARFEIAVEAPEPEVHDPEPRATREAVGSLYVYLSPQERAAFVLKDVFSFSLEEVAQMLSTSVGAVKTALHRGRGKLREEETSTTRTADPGVLDTFCNAFNARDLDRLAALLLDGATVELVGVVTEYGADEAKDPYRGSFAGMLSAITNDERGGVAAELLADYIGVPPRCEARLYRDQHILLFWYDHDRGPAVRAVMTLETDGERIALARNYFFNADVIAEVCTELGVSYRVNGYRYWHRHGS